MSAYKGKLAIYAQEHWHDPAHIVGNKEALTALRDAIDKAIQDGSSSTNWVDHFDGEGYPVVVLSTEDPEFWINGKHPYRSPICNSVTVDNKVKYSRDLVSFERYRELCGYKKT